METGILQAAARYAQQELGSEGFRYASAVVAAKEKFARTLPFLDGVIEHISDATAV